MGKKAEYKNKRRYFSTPENAPFMRDFFSHDDITSASSILFDDKEGIVNQGIECTQLTAMLNNVLRRGACFYPHIDTVSPSRADEKELLQSISTSADRIREDMIILLQKYGYLTYQYLNHDIEQLQSFSDLADKMHRATKGAIERIDGRLARIIYSSPTSDDKKKVTQQQEVLIIYDADEQTFKVGYCAMYDQCAQSSYREYSITDNNLLTQYRTDYFDEKKSLVKNSDHINKLNIILEKLDCPALIITPSEKKRGDNTFNAAKYLIDSLIKIYEKFTGRKVKDNFKQPKVHAQGATYQGQFYDFCHAVFKAIDCNYEKRCTQQPQPTDTHLFYIDLDKKHALGKQILAVIRKSSTE